MADAQKASINVFFVTAALVLVGLIGIGVLYLSGPRENIDEGETTPDSTGGIRTSDEAATLDTLRQGLVLSEYTLKPAGNVVEGSVMNNTNQPFVNVQVAFDLLSADSTLLATTRDTASEVGPGGSWYFRAVYPPDVAPASARNAEVSGTQKEVTGQQTDPTYDQNEREPGS